MINDDWLNDPKIVEWLELIHSKRTVKNYKREFAYFLEFVRETTEYKTPTEIFDSRLQQLKSDDMNVRRFWEDVGIKYMHYLEDKEYRKTTIAGYLRTMLSFFSKTHVQLQYSRKELIGAIRPKGKGKGRALSKAWIPDKEDVKQLYRFGESPRDRAIVLTLFQSGVSQIDVCQAMIEDFDFFDEIGNWKIDTNKHVYWSNERSKSREVFQTCLSSEALEEIRIYLQSRGNPATGYLFVSFRGEPLNTRDINAIVKRIVEKAFNDRVKEWKTKNMRDGFMNALEMAKIPQKIADLMVGHKPEGAKSSYKVSEATIKMNYKDAFQFLSVNGHAQQQKKLEELTQIYADKEKADFTRFGCAIALALGKTEEEFLEAYEKKVELQNEEAVNADSVAFVLLDFCKNHFQKIRETEKLTHENWEGTPTQLLQTITVHAQVMGINTKSKFWPTVANAFSRRVNTLSSSIQALGFEIITKGGNPRKIIIIPGIQTKLDVLEPDKEQRKVCGQCINFRSPKCQRQNWKEHNGNEDARGYRCFKSCSEEMPSEGSS